MSRIVLFSEHTDLDMRTLMSLKQALGCGLSEVQNAITSRRPILDCTLFMNDHDDVARRIRAVLKLLEDAHVPLQVFELEPDEDSGSCPRSEGLISLETLENILREWPGR